MDDWYSFNIFFCAIGLVTASYNIVLIHLNWTMIQLNDFSLNCSLPTYLIRTGINSNSSYTSHTPP